MVIHEENDTPVEAPFSKETKRFVVIKNHVRELLPESEGSSLMNSDKAGEKSNKTDGKKSLKRKKPSQKVLPSISTASDISKSDLEELKIVYRKCKTVLHKIESKYGQLLNLEDDESLTSTSEESSPVDCSCLQKKKIVFDENGQQIEKECQLINHICTKRIKKSHRESQSYIPAVQVEYDNLSVNLPNDLLKLENILKDSHIGKSYRRMVIDKIYLIRQEYLNEIRYEKQAIINQLKENPDDLLDFRGTNIATLPGYPTMPIKETLKNICP